MGSPPKSHCLQYANASEEGKNFRSWAEANSRMGRPCVSKCPFQHLVVLQYGILAAARPSCHSLRMLDGFCNLQNLCAKWCAGQQTAVDQNHVPDQMLTNDV